MGGRTYGGGGKGGWRGFGFFVRRLRGGSNINQIGGKKERGSRVERREENLLLLSANVALFLRVYLPDKTRCVCL